MSSPDNIQHTDPASHPGSSRRPEVTPGTTQPPPARATPTTERSRTRSTTGALPLISRERNARHLPEISPFPAPHLCTPSPTISDFSTPPSAALVAARLLENETGDDEQDTPVQLLDDQTAHQTVTDRQYPHVSRPAPLKSRIREVERRVGIYLNVIMSTLIRLEQVDSSSDSSSDDEKGVLREELRALREEVAILRCTNSGTTIVKGGTDPAPLLDQIQPARDRASISRISTVDQEDESRPLRPSRSRSSSRRTARSSHCDSRRTSSRIKHDDSTDTDSERSLSDEEGQNALAVSFHQRQKGPKHPGLDSLVPSDERFDRLISYSYYRLIDTRPIRTNQSTTRLHKTLKNIELTMRDRKFNGEDPVLVLDFLSRVVEEADTLGMSEGQLIVCLPHLLTKKAAHHFRSASSHSRSGGLVCWPDAVHYLLRTHATEQAIREAVEHLENLLQASNEDENTFASRVGVAAYRCGNVHTEVEKIAIFVICLLPAIRSIISRFRREQPRKMLTFDRIVSYARDEGDSYRARMPTRSQSFGPANRKTPPDAHRATRSMNKGSSLRPSNRMVTFLEPPSTKSQDQDGLYHLEQPTSETNDDACQQDENMDHLLAFRDTRFDRSRPRSRSPGGRVQPPRIAGYSSNDNLNRPWWEVQKPIPICYDCYGHGHYSNDCRKSIAHFAGIISNYESLRANDNARVPDKNYLLECQLTRPSPAAQPGGQDALSPNNTPTSLNATPPPKN